MQMKSPHPLPLGDQKPHGQLLNQDQVADLLGISARTLERYRVTGEGPPYIKLGRRVIYRWVIVEEWVESRLRRSTSEAGR
jgi:predicted DNA-binding transcriptional regulator AlpA